MRATESQNNISLLPPPSELFIEFQYIRVNPIESEFIVWVELKKTIFFFLYK